MFLIVLLLVFAAAGTAQRVDADSSRVEATGSYWPVHTDGTIQANGTPVDLRSDLGVSQNSPTFAGKLDVRLSRRNRISAEGTPLRLDGRKDLYRSITYQGRTFSISDQVTSTASLDYFYAGYEFDLVSSRKGRLGLEAGGAYLNATGAITGQLTRVTASKSQTVGMPLAGIAFRAFPLRRALDVEVNGELKGMALGKYGNFVQAGASVGIGRGHLFVEGGYRFLKADIHDAREVNAVAPTFRGPVVSLYFRL